MGPQFRLTPFLGHHRGTLRDSILGTLCSGPSLEGPPLEGSPLEGPPLVEPCFVRDPVLCAPVCGSPILWALSFINDKAHKIGPYKGPALSG